MSEQNKTYVPCFWIVEKTFTNGNTILKINLKAKEVAEFLLANAKDNGRVTLGISRRKSVGRNDETHCAWLDTWQPDPNRQRQPQPQPQAKAQSHFDSAAEAFRDGPPPF